MKTKTATQSTMKKTVPGVSLPNALIQRSPKRRRPGPGNALPQRWQRTSSAPLRAPHSAQTRDPSGITAPSLAEKALLGNARLNKMGVSSAVRPRLPHMHLGAVAPQFQPKPPLVGILAMERCTVAGVSSSSPPDELEAERLLCERAHQGDREALGKLLKAHGPRLYRSVLLPRLGNRALAEEALGQTYLKVVERFDKFSWQKVGVYPWLRVVAMRVALDQLRKRKREVLFEPSDVERELEQAESDQREHDLLERHDLGIARKRVEHALSRINPRYAKAIRRRILEGRSREEIAGEFEISVATFDVLLHRAMASLKKSLSLQEGAST